MKPVSRAPRPHRRPCREEPAMTFRRLALAMVSGILIAGPASALTITATFDATITSDPQASTIISTINSAIAQYQSKILDGTTEQILFYEKTTGLGSSHNSGLVVPYTTFVSALQANANSADDAVALSYLPAGPNNPVNNNANIRMSQCLSRTLGLASAPQGAPAYRRSLSISSIEPAGGGGTREHATLTDLGPVSIEAATLDTIWLNTSICNLSPSQADPLKYSLFAVTCHEIDENLGFGSTLNSTPNGGPTSTNWVQPEDLFRYDPRGHRSWSSTLTDTAYCSFDGSTILARFNQDQDGDYSDWYSPGNQVPQVQDAFGTQGSTPQMGVEWRVLDAIGYRYSPVGLWVDFNWSGTQTGAYATPYRTLAGALAVVPANGTIFIKGPGHTTELPTISAAMTIASVYGLAGIGY
jgi:hypothetical protein